jgi:hypothetical protein
MSSVHSLVLAGFMEFYGIPFSTCYLVKNVHLRQGISLICLSGSYQGWLRLWGIDIVLQGIEAILSVISIWVRCFSNEGTGGRDFKMCKFEDILCKSSVFRVAWMSHVIVILWLIELFLSFFGFPRWGSRPLLIRRLQGSGKGRFKKRYDYGLLNL